jgi:hypothetical protein
MEKAMEALKKHESTAVCTWKTPEINWAQVDDSQHEAAKAYVSAVTRHPKQGRTKRVPGIPEGFEIDFSCLPLYFQPDDIWALRHLPIRLRHMEYMNFVQLGLHMKHPKTNVTYWSVWSVLWRENATADCE